MPDWKKGVLPNLADGTTSRFPEPSQLVGRLSGPGRASGGRERRRARNGRCQGHRLRLLGVRTMIFGI